MQCLVLCLSLSLSCSDFRSGLTGQETPGEDPEINSQYAVEYIQGFQEDARDPSRLKASAACKHFAAYSFENSTMAHTDRYHFNAVVSTADLEESFLPSFKACVGEARSSGIMCSYNEINGVP